MRFVKWIMLLTALVTVSPIYAQIGPLPCGAVSSITTWRQDVAYQIGQVVILNGVTYQSLTNTNLNQNPCTFAGSQWSNIVGAGPGASLASYSAIGLAPSGKAYVVPSQITGGITDAFAAINAAAATLPAAGGLIDATGLGTGTFTVTTPLTALNTPTKPVTLLLSTGTTFLINTSFATPTNTPASCAVPVGGTGAAGSAIIVPGYNSFAGNFLLGPSARVWDVVCNGDFTGSQETLRLDGVVVQGNSSATVMGALMHLAGVFVPTRIANSGTYQCFAQCLRLDAGTTGTGGPSFGDVIFDNDHFSDTYGVGGSYPGSVVVMDALNAQGGFGNVNFYGGMIEGNGPHNALLVINGRGSVQVSSIGFFGTTFQTAPATPNGFNANVDPIQLIDVSQVLMTNLRVAGNISASQSNLVDISATTSNVSYGINLNQIEAFTGFFTCLVHNSIDGTCETGFPTGLGDTTMPYYTYGQVFPIIRQTNTTPPGGTCINGSIWTNSSGTDTTNTVYQCVGGVYVAIGGGGGGVPAFTAIGTATSSANFNSNQAVWSGSYWNGTGASADQYVIQDVVTSGTNPVTLLNIFHTGSPGGNEILMNPFVTLNGGAAVVNGQLLQMQGLNPSAIVCTDGSRNLSTTSCPGAPPTGTAGGGLTGTYPNPGIFNVITGQPAGGAGGVMGSIKTLSVDLFSTTGCTTTSGGVTQTQYDCAYFKAKDQAVGSGNPVDLYVGVEFALSCIPMTEPTAGFYGVNLIGSTLGATTILQSCPTWNSGTAYVTNNRVYLASTNSNYIAIAGSTGLSPDTNPGSWTVITPAPMLSKTAGFAYLKLANIRFNGQNRATSCADVAFLSNFELRNLDCTNIISGSDHMWQFGSSSGFAQGGVLENVWASPPYAINQTFATITPTFTGTALTGLSCGGSCGSGYNSSYATGIVNDPHKVCSVLPVFTVAITSGAISGFTITTPGTCSSAPDFIVMNQQNIAAGFRLFVSDSTVKDLQPNNGIIGAELRGGNNAVIHSHPTSVQIGWVVNNSGNADFVGSEPDTTGQYAFTFLTNQNVIISGTLKYSAGGPHLPGNSMFNFTSTSNNVQVIGVGAICPITCSTDFQEFTGPAGVLTPGGAGWPTGVCVYGNDPVNGSGDYCGQLLPKFANTTVAVTSATQNANTCSSGTNVTITGLATTNLILPSYSSDPSGLNGWGSTGGMEFYVWPSGANTMTWKVCNPTGANITYSSITFNVGFK